MPETNKMLAEHMRRMLRFIRRKKKEPVSANVPPPRPFPPPRILPPPPRRSSKE
jgi:hypothetical protein